MSRSTDRISFVADLARNWARLRCTPPVRAAHRPRARQLSEPRRPHRQRRRARHAGLDHRDLARDRRRRLPRQRIFPRRRRAHRALLLGPDQWRSRPRGRRNFPAQRLRHLLRDACRARCRTRSPRAGARPSAIPSSARASSIAGPSPFRRCAAATSSVAVQPSRGYDIDPKATYHDPDLVPPHGYLAFYAWLARWRARRTRSCIWASTAISNGCRARRWRCRSECFPEAALGPLPHLYPFIVNDPGEGTQAKRRAQAVIVDHLTPPLTRAESYGALAELERLVDEYYAAVARRSAPADAAAPPDPRSRCAPTGSTATAASPPARPRPQCLDEARRLSLRVEGNADPRRAACLRRIARGRAARRSAVALARLPRGHAPHAGLAASARSRRDLGLGFDPLDADLGRHLGWRAAAGARRIDGAWRSAGDTVERLEASGAPAWSRATQAATPRWTRTRAVLDWIDRELRPAVDRLRRGRDRAACCAASTGASCRPGPSGAPTRGRPDVLPTGRNFFSLDIRAVPTPAAWQLGWTSAAAPGRAPCAGARRLSAPRRALGLGHRQYAHRRRRRRAGAGADGRAAALGRRDRPRHRLRDPAGVASSTGRASTSRLRVSGLLPRRVSQPHRPRRQRGPRRAPRSTRPRTSTRSRRVSRRDRARLEAAGVRAAEAARRAGYRVFGSKPGAYGAGLQALIDERGWHDRRATSPRPISPGAAMPMARGAEGVAERRTIPRPARARRSRAPEPGQPRARSSSTATTITSSRAGSPRPCAICRGRSADASITTIIRGPERPRIRTLEEEVGRVVRARVVNPKWIAGVMRHGYKGGFEIAATVDYLFAFAATARAVRDHHFDAVYAAYLE